MSTALLYHGFELEGYSLSETVDARGVITMKIRQDPGTLRCANCRSRKVTRRGTVTRLFRTVPIGKRRVFLELPVQRVECHRCGLVAQVRIAFAGWRLTYAYAFERYALELLRMGTIQDVALHLGVSWDVIKDIQKRNLKRRFARPKLDKLRTIAIDEISIGKGHHYLTVVLDLDSGAVVFVGNGKGADALKPFWRKLGPHAAKIKAVAMDMSPAYTSAVMTNLPKAAIVYDHFHIAKLFNHKLSELRREMHREAQDIMEKKVLKGTRWLLLKNPENLDPKHNELQRLEEALRINKPLATAYYMKEELRQFWHQRNKDAARRFLRDWIARAEVSGVKALQQMAKVLASHSWGLLSYYDHPISTAALEGTNTKIRVMQRQAYGFRDYEFFKLKILALHESKYALVG